MTETSIGEDEREAKLKISSKENQASKSKERISKRKLLGILSTLYHIQNNNIATCSCKRVRPLDKSSCCITETLDKAWT